MTLSTIDSTPWEPYSTEEPEGIPLVIRRQVLSPGLRNYRDVVAALPLSYHQEPDRTYPIIYMQDGQNLFDPATSYAGDWRLSQTLAELSREGTEAIVIGIANTGKHRLDEYSPFQHPGRGGGAGDRYLAFIAETLKPMVDRCFRTRPARPETFIAGSSMGGLISLYALYRYADVFGGGAVLSPSLWFANRAIFRYVEENANLAVGRLYLDIGLNEPESAIADVRRLRDLISERGSMSETEFAYVEDAAGRHNEATWGIRVRQALSFLLESE